MRSKFSYQKELEAPIVNNVTLAAERTSSTVPSDGFNMATFFFKFTRSAATDVSMEVDASEDGGGTWYKVHELDASAPPTLTSGIAHWTNAVTGNENWVWNVPVNYPNLRIRVNGTSGGSSDLLTVRVVLGVL